jgi:hypothetical protein
MHHIQFSPSLVRSPDAHGELDSPAPEACGYEGTPARLLLRVTLPQFPALPDLTCARGTALLFDTLSACDSAKDVVGVAAEGVDGEEKSRSTSVPLKECLALGVVALVLLRRCYKCSRIKISSAQPQHTHLAVSYDIHACVVVPP